MDKFVTVVKPSTARLQKVKLEEEEHDKHQTPQSSHRYAPYNKQSLERGPKDWKEKKRVEKLLAPLVKDGAKPSSAALTKHLLSTLSDESNPITHSDIYSRTDHVTSTATGHQRSDGRLNQSSYHESRNRKLKAQLRQPASAAEAKILSGVCIYIDGYLKDTTDIEMKKIVSQAGGTILYSASRATHILTSQQLNGFKTHKVLHLRSRIKVHVVRPEWVTDSIHAGKRLSERSYSVIQDESHNDLAELLGEGPSRNVSSKIE